MKRPWQSRGLDMRQLQEAVGSPLPEAVRQAHAIGAVLTRMLTEGTHGNPRQIKRFLNTMMLRQAIAQRTRVRRRNQAPRARQDHAGGAAIRTSTSSSLSWRRLKPASLRPLHSSSERSIRAVPRDAKLGHRCQEGRRQSEEAEVLTQEVADWSKNEWIRGWASMDPTLTDVDLRPYVFVTRDKRGAVGGFAGSAHLESVVERLMGGELWQRRGCRGGRALRTGTG